MNILKHGAYFSLVNMRMVHCPKCHCIFVIDSVDDVRFEDQFLFEEENKLVRSIATYCPECSEHIQLETLEEGKS